MKREKTSLQEIDEIIESEYEIILEKSSVITINEERERREIAIQRTSRKIIDMILSDPQRFSGDTNGRDLLINLINRFKMDLPAVGRTFGEIREELKEELKRLEASDDITNPEYFRWLRFSLNRLDFMERKYYSDDLRIFYEGHNLGDISISLRETLKNPFILNENFKQALVDAKTQVDQRIQAEQDRLLLNESIGISESDDQIDSLKFDELEDEKDIVLRQKIISLMLLTFGRIDAPEDITQETIVKFFRNLIGGNIKKVRNLIKNPTSYKEDSKRSLKLLCDDLNAVRSAFGTLGLNSNVEKARSEIEFLIESLESSD